MATVTPVTVATKPFDGQQPGTSGLRKATKVFMQPHYTENFVQATLSAMVSRLANSTLVVGGDGRFYGKEATLKIIQMCAANKVGAVSISCNIMHDNVNEFHTGSCLYILHICR